VANAEGGVARCQAKGVIERVGPNYGFIKVADETRPVYFKTTQIISNGSVTLRRGREVNVAYFATEHRAWATSVELLAPAAGGTA
jgi:cold shock CspA family protein